MEASADGGEVKAGDGGASKALGASVSVQCTHELSTSTITPYTAHTLRHIGKPSKKSKKIFTGKIMLLEFQTRERDWVEDELAKEPGRKGGGGCCYTRLHPSTTSIRVPMHEVPAAE